MKVYINTLNNPVLRNYISEYLYNQDYTKSLAMPAGRDWIFDGKKLSPGAGRLDYDYYCDAGEDWEDLIDKLDLANDSIPTRNVFENNIVTFNYVKDKYNQKNRAVKVTEVGDNYILGKDLTDPEVEVKKFLFSKIRDLEVVS